MKTQRETPDWLAEKMTAYAINQHTVNLKSVRVLEPSAGIGTLVDKLRRNLRNISSRLVISTIMKS